VRIMGGGGSGSGLAVLVELGASSLEGQRGLIRLAKVTNHKYLRLIDGRGRYGRRGESWGRLILAVRRGYCDFGDWIAVAVGSNGERDSYIYLLNKSDAKSRDRVCESLRLLEEAKAINASSTASEDYFKVYNYVDALMGEFDHVLDNGAGDSDFELLRADIDALRVRFGRHLVDLAIVAWHLNHGYHMPLVFVIDDFMVLHSRLPDYIMPTRCLYELCLGWVA